MAHVEQVGFGEAAARGVRAADALPRDVVYAGFSLGVTAAQQLARTRGGARGALLVHACLPVSEFGAAWPDGVAVQVHAMEDDPLFTEDADAARALVAGSRDAELFLYPGDRHPFADRSLTSYEPGAAGLFTQRAIEFPGSVGDAHRR